MNGYVHAKGRSIVDQQGNELLLRGIGLGNWLLPEGYMFGFRRANSPRMIDEAVCQLVGEEAARDFWTQFRQRYVTRDDIELLAGCGCNHVRIPFSHRLFVTDTWPRRLEGPGYELIDRTIGWCRDLGISAILDLHGAPGGQTGDNIDDSWGYPFLLIDERSRELTIELWTELARRYANEPVVAGYELLNEPIATHFDRARLNPLLNDLYQGLVRAIRDVDPNHLIILGGSAWNTDFSLFEEPPDDNLAYAFHRYWAPVTPSLIEDYVAFRDRWNVPLYMSESGENDDDWVESFRALLESESIGWAFWPYKKVNSTRGPVSIPAPPGWDAIVAFAEHPRATFEQIREAHPGLERAASILEAYLGNLPLETCSVQNGFLKALGLGGDPWNSV